MKKWKLLSSEIIFQSKWLSLKTNTYKISNGNIIDNYYQIDKDDCVVIIAEKDEHIVVIKQYRRGIDKVIYELPAGIIENNESIINTALRELEEETGYKGNARLLNFCYPQPAFLSMKTNFVYVKVTNYSNQSLDVDENIEVQLLSIEAINKMISKGDIVDLSFIAGMHLLNLMKNKL